MMLNVGKDPYIINVHIRCASLLSDQDILCSSAYIKVYIYFVSEQRRMTQINLCITYEIVLVSETDMIMYLRYLNARYKEKFVYRKRNVCPYALRDVKASSSF